MAGIHHNPMLTQQQQREIAGWFKFPVDQNSLYDRDFPFKPISIPRHDIQIDVNDGETKYLITQRVQTQDEISRTFYIKVRLTILLFIYS